MANWHIPVGQGITGTVAATREPVRTRRCAERPALYPDEPSRCDRNFAVPLVFKNQLIGVLDVQSAEPDYFTLEQQEILVLLASRLLWPWRTPAGLNARAARRICCSY